MDLSFEQLRPLDVSPDEALERFQVSTGIHLSSSFVLMMRNCSYLFKKQQENYATQRSKSGNIPRRKFENRDYKCSPLNDGLVARSTTLDIQIAFLRYRYLMVRLHSITENQKALRSAEMNREAVLDDLVERGRWLDDFDERNKRELQVPAKYKTGSHSSKTLKTAKDGLMRAFGVGRPGRRLSLIARNELVGLLRLCRKEPFRETVRARELWDVKHGRLQWVPSFSSRKREFTTSIREEIYKVAFEDPMTKKTKMKGKVRFPQSQRWQHYSQWVRAITRYDRKSARKTNRWLSLRDIVFLLIALHVEEGAPIDIMKRLEMGNSRGTKLKL